MTLVTQKEFARRIGVTPQYVNKLVSRGVITLVQGRVNPAKAKAAVAAMSPRGVGSRQTAAKKVRRPKVVRRTAAKKADKPPSATRSYVSAKAEREHWQALSAKLEYEKTVGTLLPAAEVIQAEQRKNANLRMRLRKLARSMAPMLARLTVTFECEQYLLGEVDQVLEELATDPLGLKPDAVQTSAQVPPAAPAVEPIAENMVPEVAAEIPAAVIPVEGEQCQV